MDHRLPRALWTGKILHRLPRAASQSTAAAILQHLCQNIRGHYLLGFLLRVYCEQWAQGQIAGQNSDFNTTIDGTTAPFAVNAWYGANRKGAQSGSTEFVHKATAKYPCSNCCNGGDGP